MRYDNQRLRSINSRAAGFARGCRKAVLCLCSASALLVASTASPVLASMTVEVTNFGSNLGKLKMFKHIPDQMPASAALVVVMHGCKQNARTFTDESGWTLLSDKLHVALVMPQQQQANNQNNCFNWFDPANNVRDKGEALSIRQMVDKMKADHSIDPNRVFVTGLSAGGAMTSVMLAVYPEVFSGGAIIAGLPYGCANNLVDALQCMQTGHPSGGPMISFARGGPPSLRALSKSAGGIPLPPSICLFFPLLCPPSPAGGSGFTPTQWGDFVRHASHHTGAFPRVSIWHGSADTTVNPVNETSEMQQWTNVHGIDPTAAVQNTVKGFPHQVFKNASGKAVVETFSITGMSHGDPVDPGPAQDQCGTADQFMLNVHICSSLFVARFWELTE
jgi:poly(hydroxyalkanoate) depolymerase family esterase